MRHGLVDRAVAEPVDVAQPDTARAQRLARTDHDSPGGGVEPHHIERRAGGDAETTPLADGEMNDAVMMAEHPAAEIDDFARTRGARPQPFDDVGVMPGRHEADVLTVLFIGNGQLEAARQFARFRLAAFAERESQQIELRRRGGEQEIALIAFSLAGAIERPAAVRQRARSDIMAGRQHRRAEVARGVQ